MTVKVSLAVENEGEALWALYEEAIPHFLKVEGRKPLKPFGEIRELIGHPSSDEEMACYSIYSKGEIAGYAWILERPMTYYYVLHFYIGNKFKRQRVGKRAISVFDDLFRTKGIHRSELMVSGANYLGLVFWTVLGYNQIIYVAGPAENATISVEIELAREF